MPSLPLPFTRFARRRLPLRQASARLLAFGVAAVATGTIMVGAGLEAVPAMPLLSSLAVEHVLAAGIAPEAAAVDRRTLPLLTTKTHVIPPLPAPAPVTVFDLDRRARLAMHEARMEDARRAVAGAAPTVTLWEAVPRDSPADRRAYLLGAAIQARSPTRAALVTNPGRPGTASFCPSGHSVTCRPAA